MPCPREHPQPVHTALSLRSAMTTFFKLKNLATCAHFCRRLLELNPGQKVRLMVHLPLSRCAWACAGWAGQLACVFCTPLGVEWPEKGT